jgi:heavy metal translocating P-type ATPase
MSGAEDSDDRVERIWENAAVRWSGFAGVLLAAGFLAERAGIAGWLVTGLFVAATLAGARFFGPEAIEELVGEFEIGIELLMTVAAVAAGSLGLWGEAASLAFLYSISEALEEFTEDRTRNSIRALMDLAPKQVDRIDADGTIRTIPIEELRLGDRFLVRPGSAVATDGVVCDGASAIDESAVTGESIPVAKQVDDRVFAGTLNTTGALTIEATATAEDNTLTRIVSLVSEAQQAKGEGQQFLDRFAPIYSPGVLVAGIIVATVGGSTTGDWSVWIIRAATVIVAAAPCALVISIPVTYVAAIGNASRKGILIKGGIHLEELARVTTVALDKTGTITQNKPSVTQVFPVGRESEDTVLAAAAAVEQRSEHPLGRAIVAAANDREIPRAEARDFLSLPGAGATADVVGRIVLIGSPSLMDERGIDLGPLSERITRLEDAGATAVVVAADGNLAGVIGVADQIRETSRTAIASLRDVGVDRVVMLTGDNPRTAARVAEQAGIDEVHAALKPSDKAAIITDLARERHVAMVGDGVNDAPALAAASVGVAMGAAGSDVALETADVALMADDLRRLRDAVELGRRTRRLVVQNLTMSLVILAALIPGALLGLFSLPVAVAAHELSELFVILNGVRAARSRHRKG